MQNIIPLLQIVIENLPGAVKTATELYGLGEKFFASVNGREPTAAEKAQLRADLDADVALALEPLPPAQPGDEDYVKPVV